jgi:hypothetical protein
MPIYMDRHDVSEKVTAENVAQLHQQDLKIQHKFNCRGLTYWFDDQRKTAFCLIEAPDEGAIHEMHRQAHGEVPHRVIEVDPKVVESFLGRIEDPEKSNTEELNVINDPAFRAIMVIELVYYSLLEENLVPSGPFFRKHTEIVSKTINRFSGRIAQSNTEYVLASFKSVSRAIDCAKEILSDFTTLIAEDQFNIGIKIGISAGSPVTRENALFEKAIRSAKRMCEAAKSPIIVSAGVKDLYLTEKANPVVESEPVYFLTPSDESFLHMLMDFTESRWSSEDLGVEDFKTLGFSESQLYRRITDLTGKSPNSFLKEYRLKKAVQLLKKNEANISEVSAMAGFNSPSYFAKCFKDRYCISPSDYVNTRLRYSLLA